jgi:hypothetical protein
VSIQIKVRSTSETVVGDSGIEHQRDRVRCVGPGSPSTQKTMLFIMNQESEN